MRLLIFLGSMVNVRFGLVTLMETMAKTPAVDEKPPSVVSPITSPSASPKPRVFLTLSMSLTI